jgi:cytosine/adenosine deaminase-related metal-dependent hydrolase
MVGLAGRARRQSAEMTSDATLGRGTQFVNARLSQATLGWLRVVDGRIATMGEGATPKATLNGHKGPDADVVIDLKGDRLLPGLINAHDHLQLNNLPRSVVNRPYRHASEWVANVNEARRSDPAFEASVAVPRTERLLIGGIKNLLSGVTTVAHHDPFHPFLASEDFPIRVVRDYGWSHSLYLEGEHQVRLVHRHTPASSPWIIHAAEGVDADARGEFERLEALGCITANTLLVHGIALQSRQRQRLIRRGGGLVWCPSSNFRLFGKTAQIREFVAAQRVALGTDSRLSGGEDLLEELRVAAESNGLDETSLEHLVTRNAASLLRLRDRGTLTPGMLADLLVLPDGAALPAARRADVRLVMIGGRVRYGEPDYLAAFGDIADGWTAVRVDGATKLLASDLAGLLGEARVAERGLELCTRQGQAA